ISSRSSRSTDGTACRSRSGAPPATTSPGVSTGSARPTVPEEDDTMRKNPPRNLLPVAALAAAALAVTSTYAQPGSDRESDDAHAASTDTAAASDAAAADARVTPLLTEPLVGIPGKEVSISVVEYAPGGASPPHRHNANVFVYVLDGEV